MLSLNMSTNLKVAHLVNPYKCAEDNPSYLYYAQPITFRSMYEAKLFAEGKGVQVELVAANFLEDDEIVPDYFTKLPNLTKSTQTVFPEISGNRKLPIIQEMLDSVCTHTDADIIVFTNTDVGVQRSFYVDIHKMVVRD